jgi:thiosulfate/3-mercaptopyruvate sulfurtransferase
MRAGLAGPEEFDQLPAHHQEAYDQKCATCHGTCGNCHIVRPAIAGGGLSDGHNFNKTPDWYNVCVSCHTSRGGHAFLGVDSSTDPDFHRDELDFDCMSCHDGHELHGDGQPVEQRYAYSELPTCESVGCHEGLEQSNIYHNVHYEDFQCQICHSQDYNNCGACHIKDGHPEFEAYMDYKIALNTLPDLKNYEFALVRRTLAHPENWVGYGEDLAYSNFDVFPTYNYTTPHNILKKTLRTNVDAGQACSSKCHIRNEAGTLINAEYYLWADSLETWEVDATSAYTVDGQLPASWFVEK